MFGIAVLKEGMEILRLLVFVIVVYYTVCSLLLPHVTKKT